MPILLSVYITTYNRSDMLKKMIDSVLSQTFSDFVLYILDNASTDNTKYIIKEYNDKRIHYIRHNTNIGGLNNIKFAFKHCKSDYIIVLHDDDIICENLFEMELKVLENNKDIVAVSSDAYIIDSNDNLIGTYKYSGRDELLSNVDNYFKRFIKNGKTLVFPSTMYNNNFLKNNKVYINDFVGPCADVIFHADIERTGGKLVNINKELIKYRHHKGQDSVVNSVPMKVKLFSFLSTDEQYSKVFLNMTSEQNRIFKNISYNIIQNFVAGNIDYNISVKYINDIASCLKYKNIDKFFFNSVIRFLNAFPWLIDKVKSTYRIYKRVCRGDK